MARVKPTTDPYRVLGILRGADLEQVKAAHRRLAKRYHPDGSKGDEQRFLALQEAYQLLSDPLRRREWDRRHAPGPVRSGLRRRSRPQTGAEARPPAEPRAATEPKRPRGARAARPMKPPSERTRTWTAERVPWWEDFRPGAAPGPGPAATRSSTDQSAAAQVDDEQDGFEVYDRSSGAAWSAAARRHFRRRTDDLPSRGVWRYRGTQVVTGAEARKVAAEEEEERR